MKAAAKGQKKFLAQVWQDTLKKLEPHQIFDWPRLSATCRDADSRTAFLFWGKGALPAFEAFLSHTSCLKRAPPALVIAPRTPDTGRIAGAPLCLLSSSAQIVFGEHPLPGPGSFLAAQALLEFFGSLGHRGYDRLEVLLSGGASSLAWLKPASLSERALRQELEELYRKPLSIRELNQRRSRICGLKSGGAANWLSRLAPRVRARVSVISDVLPFGPEVVGSGPFWNGRVPHHVVADNETLVRLLSEEARRLGWPVLCAESACLGTWQDWVKQLSERARAELRAGRSGLVIRGGEPAVQLPRSRAWGADEITGGRQTQIAAALALELLPEILAGRIEILCGASDGEDGRSGSGGAWIEPGRLRAIHRAQMGSIGSQNLSIVLKKAIHAHRSAHALAKLGALLPRAATGTNVQDAVLLRIQA